MFYVDFEYAVKICRFRRPEANSFLRPRDCCSIRSLPFFFFFNPFKGLEKTGDRVSSSISSLANDLRIQRALRCSKGIPEATGSVREASRSWTQVLKSWPQVSNGVIPHRDTAYTVSHRRRASESFMTNPLQRSSPNSSQLPQKKSQIQ